MHEAPFIERRFELGEESVVARFYRPARAPGREFQCRWTIAWPDREDGRYTCGEDGVQALMLAMRLVHAKLLGSDAYKAGQLTWYGQSDLDLPPTWGQGPLDDVRPPPGDPA